MSLFASKEVGVNAVVCGPPNAHLTISMREREAFVFFTQRVVPADVLLSRMFNEYVLTMASFSIQGNGVCHCYGFRRLFTGTKKNLDLSFSDISSPIPISTLYGRQN